MKRYFAIISAVLFVVGTTAAYGRTSYRVRSIRSSHLAQLNRLVEFPGAILALLHGNPLPIVILGTGNEDGGESGEVENGEKEGQNNDGAHDDGNHDDGNHDDGEHEGGSEGGD